MIELVADASPDLLLDVDGLDAFYGRAQVLFDVSLRLRRGEVAALMGRNGAGKSTTLKAIMGLVERRATRAVFAGQPIGRLPSHRIARLGLGYVPRTDASSPTSPSPRTWRSGRQPPRAGRAPWTSERLFRIFPNLAEMRGRSATRCPAASSRCSPSPAP